MTTITDKLEGLLPADGPVTKDERVIAEAVEAIRNQNREIARLNIRMLNRWPLYGNVYTRTDPKWLALAFATGCIATAIFVVLV